jgi:dipeptidyl-peptidase-4
MNIRNAFNATIAFLLLLVTVSGQDRTTLDGQLRRIFETHEYSPKEFGPAKWLEDGRRFTTVEESEIVAYDTASGKRDVLISASMLKPAGAAKSLDIKGYTWSKDQKRLLVFTNSMKVWRDNTRGDYWVLEIATRKLRKLGGKFPEASLMFAKFSPDGNRVGYVRENNLYIEDVDSGSIRQLTKDGSATLINGTSDWVYEEEFGLRDCFRFSPDGQSIAYWQFDASGIETFNLINDTESTYPKLHGFPYPKAGTKNSAVRIGIVAVAGGTTRWIQIPGDPRNNYLARMDWLNDSSALIIERLNRLQNTNDVLLANAKTGDVRNPYRDHGEAWVDVVNDIRWLNEKEFVWITEKDGWRHAYRVGKDDGHEQLITNFNGDILDVVSVDASGGWIYFTASPENATQRYLYRSRLNGAGVERLTPSTQPGTHTYNVSPDHHWAFHTYSSFDRPPVVDLISLPEHRIVRTLVDNAALRSKVESIVKPPVEFLKVDIGEGIVLDAFMLKPANFESTRKYPLVVYVYGEPASQTVLDRWFGDRMLFLRALANEGYIVASIDNRGTPAPRGAAWRKVIYGSVGDLSSKEQAAAVQALTSKFSFMDRDRIGIWGWSGGGTNTLNAMFRYPALYKVGVSVAPVPDQKLYDTIYQERYMGLPQDNAAGYRLGSAINFAEGLRGKLLVVHGSGDDNVHYQGTERLINRLIELGKPFDVMVYPNRTHAISEGPGTSLHLHTLIARYIREHL